MPRLSLTDLVDVISKSGSPKATKVRQIKNRNEYSPAVDFYKGFRDGVVQIHQEGRAKADLEKIIFNLSDKKKKTAYPIIVEGYRKWWGQKKLAWRPPITSMYSQSGIDVSVNPELGLDIDGVPHLIKLYLKDDGVDKYKIDLITALMEHCLRSKCGNETKMAVLDVRSSKLFTLGSNPIAQKIIIDAELAYVAALWPSI